MVDAPGMKTALCLVCLFAFATALAGAEVDVGRETSGELFLRWTQTFEGGGEVDRGPTLEVYEDGTVVAVFPAYMKRAGRRSMRLSPVERKGLRRLVAGARVDEFDAGRVGDECAAQEAERRAGASDPDLYEVHDAATTRIEVAIHGSTAVRGGAGSLPVRRRVKAAWYALGATARRHPSVASIQRLDHLEQAMKKLLRDPRLKPRAEPVQ